MLPVFDRTSLFVVATYARVWFCGDPFADTDTFHEMREREVDSDGLPIRRDWKIGRGRYDIIIVMALAKLPYKI